MKYDLGIIVPMCGKFKQRIEDFKRYGLVNIGKRKVILNVVLSNEEIEGLEFGWHENIDVKIVKSDCPNYVANIYRFYAEIDSEKIEYRWLMRVDDDSCTDIDGLVSNLDEFYDCNENFYLAASLKEFSSVLEGHEGTVYPEYSHLLGRCGKTPGLLKNEVESGIVSTAAIKKIISNDSSLRLIKFRSRLYGGYTDCVIAVASAMAKVYPIDCPFISHLPSIENFSLTGGVLNHIHMIARHLDGDNYTWERASNEHFILLTKIIEKAPNEIESSLIGLRFLLETKEVLTTYEFRENHVIRAKFEQHSLMWMEHNGFVHIFNRNELIHKLSMDSDGNLTDGMIVLKKI